MIKLAIFDLDGVITSTSSAHFEAWQQLFKEKFNVLLDSNLETYTRGVSRLASLEVLLEKSNLQLDESLKEAYCTYKNDIYLSLIEHFTSDNLLPGAIEIIQFLKKHQVKIALGSASKNAPLLLLKLGLKEAFDYVVDPTNLESKPAPDIFLDAMNHFQLKAFECIAFEDAEAGIESIQRASILAIGVGSEPLQKADYKIESLTAFNTSLWERINHKA